MINKADIILLLISCDFIKSDYCYDVEMKQALERHKRKEAIVIPVYLRPVDLGNLPEDCPLASLQYLPRNVPRNRSFVTLWENEDEALRSIAMEIRQIVEKECKSSVSRMADQRLPVGDRINAYVSETGSVFSPQEIPDQYNSPLLRRATTAHESEFSSRVSLMNITRTTDNENKTQSGKRETRIRWFPASFRRFYRYIAPYLFLCLAIGITIIVTLPLNLFGILEWILGWICGFALLILFAAAIKFL